MTSDRGSLLVTSELRARWNTNGELLVPGRVDRLADPFPRSLAIRAYGDRPPVVDIDVIDLPVHQVAMSAPFDLLLSIPRMLAGVRRAGAVWVVSPGVVAGAATVLAVLARRPIVMNVVGDPSEAGRRGVTIHPLRSLARVVMPAVQRFGCRHANVVRYVASNPLQSRYPPGRECRTFVLSNVQVASVQPPREHLPSGTFRLVTVGSLEQPYKGVEGLLEAMALLTGGDLEFSLTVVGGGRLKSHLRTRAEELAPGRVQFVGQIEPEVVQGLLREHDAFVLASFTEGLPRAMIEAMAQGLPCVGTAVGGVPDLLPPRWMCAPRDAVGLATLIRQVFESDEEYVAASQHAVDIASKYSADALHTVLQDFHSAVWHLLGGSGE